MATIENIVIESDVPYKDTLRKRRYIVTIRDNNLVDKEFLSPPLRVPASDTGVDYANGVLADLQAAEISKDDKVPDYADAQADYDRKALGYAMTLESTDEFYTYLPLFLAVQSRGGANASQRAAYLGVSLANYNAMAARFNDVQGIEFFLVDAKDQVWTDPRDFV